MVIYLTIKKQDNQFMRASKSSVFLFLSSQLINKGSSELFGDLWVLGGVLSGPFNSDISEKTWEVIVFLGVFFVF